VSPGDPAHVLSYHQVSSAAEPPVFPTNLATTTWLRVAMLAAPWNPADAMNVQGRYPSPYPSSPSWADPTGFGEPSRVAGSEGLGQVTDILPCTTSDSSIVTHNDPVPWQVGDYVVPGQPGLGLMRSSLFVPASAMIRLERGDELVQAIGPMAAAPLFQTGGTALRMLQRHCHNNPPAKPGDVVLQNAGNSAVGVMVSQLAATMGLQTVSFVRKGDRARVWDDVVDYLTHRAHNALVLPEDFNATDVESVKAQLGTLSSRPPLLALNAVGGTSADTLLNLLGSNGTLVTYGGMSRQPVKVSTSHLIFRNITLTGYWHSRWMACESTALERHQLMNELVDVVLQGAVICPHVEVFALSNFQQAFEFEKQQSTQPIRRKIVFDCREEST
jgi:mitochondrial enoyl-[acyl-carrier protein] reductase / trans-2-enoyl-CoA reductase